MKQASEKERREALEARSLREDKQPYATELDDRDLATTSIGRRKKRMGGASASKNKGGPAGPPDLLW